MSPAAVLLTIGATLGLACGGQVAREGDEVTPSVDAAVTPPEVVRDSSADSPDIDAALVVAHCSRILAEGRRFCSVSACSASDGREFGEAVLRCIVARCSSEASFCGYARLEFTDIEDKNCSGGYKVDAIRGRDCINQAIVASYWPCLRGDDAATFSGCR